MLLFDMNLFKKLSESDYQESESVTTWNCMQKNEN